MTPKTLLILLLILTALAYYAGLRRSMAVAGGPEAVRILHSRPPYYGVLTALWCGLPALLIYVVWQSLDTHIITRWVIADLPADMQSLSPARLSLVINDIRNMVDGNIAPGQVNGHTQAAAAHYRRLQYIGNTALAAVVMSVGVLGLVAVRGRIHAKLRARNYVERMVLWALGACSTIAIFTTIGIVLSVLYEALRFFQSVPLTEFLFGLHWSPQMAIRTDQVGSSGAFGAVPVFAGTLLISAIAMAVSVPIGLMAAIYMSEYAGKRFRSAAKPLMEILAGIPTVVYGFFAALVVAPVVRSAGRAIGLDVSSESAMAAGLVMGIMIIPFVSSLSDDMINAVPQALRDGSYGLGATQAETIKKVVLPAALPGIVGGVLLAVSRAIGETMIVVMAAGLTANMTLNPFKTVTTVTVQIVTLLVGDQEFDSPKTLAAFALGLLLFVITLGLNIIALHVVRRYREQYE
ncbi:MAG: phosphate ABC transporter permease subunit PstC [Desulfobacteraceae bacterium]|nr:MAG: phosphate ABC transporter permease subunit PstC [Desulfobacteraceae bacterium]